MEKILKINKLAKNGAITCIGISLSALILKQKKLHAVFGALSLACLAIHIVQQKKIKKLTKVSY